MHEEISYEFTKLIEEERLINLFLKKKNFIHSHLNFTYGYWEPSSLFFTNKNNNKLS